jgi:hypothetical protein
MTIDNPAPVDNNPAPVDNNPAPVDNNPAPTPEPKIEDSPFYSSFPEDWRTQAIGAAGFEGDDAVKAGNMLERVSDFPSLVKSMIESKRKISAGEISTGLPENPSDEQLAAFREAQGIPSAADAYNIEIMDNVEFSDADEAMLTGYLEAAHKGNVPESVVADMTNSFLKARQDAMDMRITQDGLDQQQAINQLKDNWGPDYEVNKNIANNLVNQLPETVRDAFRSARMPDGSSVFNSPEVLAFFADTGRKLDPSATITGSGESMNATDIQAQMKEIEDKIGTADYTKADEAKLLKLIEAQQAMQARQ